MILLPARAWRSLAAALDLRVSDEVPPDAWRQLPELSGKRDRFAVVARVVREERSPDGACTQIALRLTDVDAGFSFRLELVEPDAVPDDVRTGRDSRDHDGAFERAFALTGPDASVARRAFVPTLRTRTLALPPFEHVAVSSRTLTLTRAGFFADPAGTHDSLLVLRQLAHAVDAKTLAVEDR